MPVFTIEVAAARTGGSVELRLALIAVIREEGGYPTDIWTNEMLLSLFYRRRKGVRPTAEIRQNYRPGDIWLVGFDDSTLLELMLKQVLQERLDIGPTYISVKCGRN